MAIHMTNTSDIKSVEKSAPAALRFIDRHLAIVTGICVIALWQLAVTLFDIPTYLLPSPTAIVQGYIKQPALSWWAHAWATFHVALMGFLLAIFVSIPLAVMLVSSDRLSRAIYPIIVAINSVPIVAIAPMIIVILGAGDIPRVLITFLISFFPIVVTTIAGLMATPAEMLELSHSLRADRARCMVDIRLPYAVPYIFSALKVSVSLSLIGAVVAEFVAAERGLGYFIQFSTVNFKLNLAFGALLILVALNLAAFKAVGFAQKKLAPWSLPKTE